MNLFKHLSTITKHRHLVFKHCMQAGIFWQGLFHDCSKYSLQEFLVGVKYYQENRSPNEKERAVVGYSSAWLHHKGRNKHHFEYWLDYNPIEKRLAPIEMPTKYLIEMFCDRIAASKIYQGKMYTNASPLAYFTRSRDNILMHENTKEALNSLLVMLRDEGEEVVFQYIRVQLLHHKH